jgi:hypothetical protein
MKNGLFGTSAVTRSKAEGVGRAVSACHAPASLRHTLYVEPKACLFNLQGSQDGKRPILALLLSHAARQKELGAPSQPAVPRPPPPPTPVVEPWVVKHAPRSTAELVVHNRKVQDVRDWLLARLASAGMPVFGDSSLLISGTFPCPHPDGNARVGWLLHPHQSQHVNVHILSYTHIQVMI